MQFHKNNNNVVFACKLIHLTNLNKMQIYKRGTIISIWAITRNNSFCDRNNSTDNEKRYVDGSNEKSKKLFKSKHIPAAFPIIACGKNYNNNIEHRTKELIKNNRQPCGLHVPIQYTA